MIYFPRPEVWMAMGGTVATVALVFLALSRRQPGRAFRRLVLLEPGSQTRVLSLRCVYR